MEKILIANIISLIAQGFMIFSTTRKSKKEMLVYSSIFLIIAAIATFILGGYSAVIVNLIGIIRNILIIKDNNSISINAILLIVSIIFGVLFNNNALLGLLPIIANIEETIILLNTKSTLIQCKLAGALSCFLWVIFCIVIKNYTSALFNFISMCSYLIFIFKEINKTKII